MARNGRRALNTITDFSPRGVSLSMEIVKVIFGQRSSIESSRLGQTVYSDGRVAIKCGVDMTRLRSKYRKSASLTKLVTPSRLGQEISNV